MKRTYFRWLSLGFSVQHESGHSVEVIKFKPNIYEDQLEALFHLGYYFVNKTHHITINNMEDYEKYVLRKVK